MEAELQPRQSGSRSTPWGCGMSSHSRLSRKLVEKEEEEEEQWRGGGRKGHCLGR